MGIEDQILNKDSTLKAALKKMSLSGTKCLIVTNKEDKFLGTLSDGDLRKAILKDSNLDTPITKIFNSDSFFILKQDLNYDSIKEVFIEKQFDVIPIINEDKTVHKIISWKEVFQINQRKNL